MIASYQRLLLALAMLFVFAVEAQAAVMLRSWAQAQTSGNGILVGDTEFKSQDTGLVTINSNLTQSFSAGPVVADSTKSASAPNGSIYAFAEAEITSQAGAFHAYLQGSSSSINSGAVAFDAYTYGEWRDTIQVTSSVLPIGTPVSLAATIQVDHDITASSGVYWNVLVSTSGLPQYLRGSTSPNPVDFVVGTYHTTVGSTISLWQTLNAQVQATSFSGQFKSATLDISHTVNLFLDAPDGVTLVSESGATYQPIPEASSVLLSLVTCFFVMTRRRCQRQ